MEDLIDKFLKLVKGLMQPAITLMAIYLVLNLVLTGKVSGETAWMLPAGIVVYWFTDKMGIWDLIFGKFKNSSVSTANQEKADLIQTVAVQSQDLASSTPAPVVKALIEKLTPVAPEAQAPSPAPTNVDPDPEAYLQEIS